MKVPTSNTDRPVVRLRDFTFSHKTFLNLKRLQEVSPETLMHISNDPKAEFIRLDELVLTNYHEISKLNG